MIRMICGKIWWCSIHDYSFVSISMKADSEDERVTICGRYRGYLIMMLISIETLHIKILMCK